MIGAPGVVLVPIRLLLVARPAVGGIAGHLHALCSGLDGNGYQVSLACPAQLAVEAAHQRVNMPIADRFELESDVKVVRQCRRLFSTGCYDLVHVHGLKAASLVAAATWPKPKLPVVFTLHNTLPTKRNGVKGALQENALRRVLQAAALVIVVSQAQANDLTQRQLVCSERIRVIANGICLAACDDQALPARNDMRAQLNVQPNEVCIITVARAIAAKGLYDLLDAVAYLPDSVKACFLLVGEGPDQEGLIRHAEKRSLTKRVRFLGGRSDVPALLQAADLFVLPSHAEGMPLTIMEAMAAGLPVLATRVGGVPEVVEDGLTGLLIEPHRPSQLAASIMRLVSEPQLRQAFGAAGQKRVKTHFSHGQMLTAIKQAYANVIDHWQSINN